MRPQRWLFEQVHRVKLTAETLLLHACDVPLCVHVDQDVQKNVLNLQSWAAGEELRLTIITWIEAIYHRKRRQRSLGKLTLVE